MTSWIACTPEEIVRAQEQMSKRCQKQIIITSTITTKHQVRSIRDKDNTPLKVRA